MPRLLALLSVALKIWMFVDAVRRRADAHWFWVIALVPFGEVVYFFAVKIRDRDMQTLGRRLRASLKGRASLAELQRRAELTPSLANRVALGQGLFDARRYEEARRHFEHVLEQQPDDKDGLFGLGLCRLEQGDAAGAVGPLTRLIELHRGYRDYAAWPELATALWRTGDKDASLELVADLVRTAPWLVHCVVQARFLRDAGRRADAERVLRQALEDDRFAPGYVRRQNRSAAREARRMLQELGAKQ
ncbi:MAG: tetratricopeptide repeat protein [Deltaproteobacteria bacterium]|nr:tetratricopeptide repeat protein [Deltaproteobacteria bacterium]